MKWIDVNQELPKVSPSHFDEVPYSDEVLVVFEANFIGRQVCAAILRDGIWVDRYGDPLDSVSLWSHMPEAPGGKG